MTNVTFQPVCSRHAYSCTEMTTVYRVLWKGDWALSIQDSGAVDSDGNRFYLYGHWSLIKFHGGSYSSADLAKKGAEDFLLNFEKFLHKKFFLPKHKDVQECQMRP